MRFTSYEHFYYEHVGTADRSQLSKKVIHTSLLPDALGEQPVLLAHLLTDTVEFCLPFLVIHNRFLVGAFLPFLLPSKSSEDVC